MIFLDRTSKVSLYEQIFQALKAQIISGELQEQERLPATRKLAGELQVSRNTIDQAYSQLCAEGYLTNRQGSGYYVNPLDFSFPAETELVAEALPGQAAACADLTDAQWQKACRYNLEYGRIHADEFPLKRWKKVLDQTLLDAPPEIYTQYGPRDGLLCLREALALYLRRSRGVHCSARQIVVGCSTQYLVQMVAQLLQAVCGIATFAMEEPGFPTVRRVFQLLPVQVEGIRVAADGIDVEQLEQSAARAVYITPSHQFPTGAVLPVQKRLQLLRWARERDGFILEDDYDSELRYASQPIPALQGLCKNDGVIYLGTTSKAFSPAMRLAYMVLPERLLPAYEQLFAGHKSSVPELQQLAFAKFMGAGFWESHLRKVATANRKKHDLFVRLLEQKLGRQFAVIGKGSGVHVLLQPRNDWTERELLERARQKGVGIYPVSPCWQHPEQMAHPQVMLGYAGFTLEQLAEVAALLDQAFDGACPH